MRRTLTVLFACLLAGVLLALGITDEVPLGGIRGTVTMRENKLPLPNALVVFSPAGDKDEETSRNWHTTTKKDGSFSIANMPSGDYHVEVEAQNHSLGDRIVTIIEGTVTDLNVRMKPNDFNFSMFCNRRILAPGEQAKIELNGFAPQDSVHLAIRRIKLEAVAASGGVEQVISPVQYRRNATDRDFDQFSTFVWQEDHTIAKKNVEGSFTEPMKLPALPEGLYVLTSKMGELSNGVILNVTKVALVIKTATKKTLCYVTDIDTGVPLSGVQLSTAKGKVLTPTTKTDSQGIANITATGNGNQVIVAQRGSSVAVCGFSSGSDNSGDANEIDPNTRIFTYAERPIYRPGDTVQFKAIVRRLSGDELKLPPAGSAKVMVYDQEENLLQTQELALSSHGTIHGSFPTSSEAPPGVYRLEVHAAGGVDRYYANFAAYRKPDYSVKVTANKPRYSMGDQASATIECQYFFGGPVVGAKVRAQIYRNPAWNELDDQDEGDSEEGASSEDEGYSGGEYVNEVQGITDGTGKAVLTFPTMGDEEKNDSFYDYTYSVQASVDESDQRSFSGSGSVKVTQGDFRLSASTDPYIVTTGQTATLTVTTNSSDDLSKPIANRTVKVEVGSEKWFRHTIVFEPLQSYTLQTDAAGKASMPLVIGEAKNIRIRASAADDAGRKIQSQTYLYVEGSDAFEDPSGPSLKVKLDRKQYRVGDTVKALVTTNSPGGSALFTVESDNIKLMRLVRLDKASAIVRFAVGKESSPNAFVNVAYVRDRRFSTSSHRLTVKRFDKQLKLTVTPDKSKTLPGSDVAFKVKATDQSGHGVSASVSVGVVDESIYAIKKDGTNIVRGLYPQKEDFVLTAYSFPDIQLDGGDKGGGSVPVRRKFLDTASWNPEVQTDSSGNASVTVKLPDNLTSWRATAVAASDDSQVGMTTSNVQASKPLMVRLLTPQFLVGTDRQVLAAAITNDSGGPLDVKFQAKFTGLTLQNTPPDSLHLDQGQTTSVPLDVVAGASGTADIVAEVRSDKGFTDAVDGHFPVLPHGRLVVDHKSGIVGPDTSVSLTALPNRDANTGGLTVTITPSAASGMLQSLDALVQFPYGCVEQTMSRFLPAILVTQSLHNTPLRREDLEKRTVAIANDGFQRLLKMQHGDGSWGWWTYDASDPFMTALVLDGLMRADKAGFPKPPYLNVKKALEWSEKRLKSPFKDDSLAAMLYLTYALAKYDHKAPAKSALLAMKLDKAGVGELALAAMAAGSVDEPGLRDEALAKMLVRIKNDDIRPSNKYVGLWSTNEHRALALLALTELQPQSEEIPRLARTLLTSRGCYGWSSTRETSLTIAGLCNYLGQKPDTFKPSTVEVLLNGQSVKSLAINPATDSKNLEVKVPLRSLKDGSNQLQLKGTGGEPFFAAELKQYDVQEHLAEVVEDADLTVKRRYFRMEAREQTDGTMKLLPSPLPISSAKSGDVIRCELTLHCVHPMDFLMVEDPIPSNCRVTDREDPGDGEEWSYWWSSLVILDDRVSLFAREMDKGNHKLTYTMRVEGTGASSALPTRIEDMYQPDISASGGETNLAVQP